MIDLNSFKFKFFNVYGLGEEHKGNQRSPVSKFAEQAVQNGVIEIFEDLKTVKTLSGSMMLWTLWITMVLDLIYDLGSGRLFFPTVAEIIAEKFGAEIKEIPFPEHLKDKYQYNTISNFKWDEKEFVSMRRHRSPLVTR